MNFPRAVNIANILTMFASMITFTTCFVGKSVKLQNCSCWEKNLLTDRTVTVPLIVKTVYLLRRKSCARFSIILNLSGENPR